MRSRRSLISAAVVSMLLAFGAGIALGQRGELKERTKTVGVSSEDGEEDGVTAKCKKGTQAVSGAFETDASLGADAYLIVSESRRRGRRGWSASAFNFVFGTTGDLISSAFCRDQKLKRRSASVGVDGLELGRATAKCPKGTKVFSGGFDAEERNLNGPSPNFFIRTSRKVGRRRWEVAAFNNSGTQGDLAAYAYCGEGRKLKTAERSDTVTNTNYPRTGMPRSTRSARRASASSPADSPPMRPPSIR
jgi:hypothetical protein